MPPRERGGKPDFEADRGGTIDERGGKYLKMLPV